MGTIDSSHTPSCKPGFKKMAASGLQQALSIGVNLPIKSPQLKNLS